MRGVAVCSTLLITLSVLLTDRAEAQTETPEANDQASLTARDLFQRGTAAYSVGNYDQAIRDWEEAYNTDPRPRIKYNISQAYERLGRLEEAIDALETFISDAEPGDSRYSDANARLAALRQRLALTGVMIYTDLEGGQILIDGADWGRTPRPDKITVTPGAHQVVIRWDDGREYLTNVVVPAGQVIEVTVGADGLHHSPAPSDPGPTVSQPPPSSSPISPSGQQEESSGPALVPLVIAGGAGAIGIGMFAWGINRQAELGGCGDEGFTCLNESTVSTQRTVGMVLGGLFIAGGVTALVLALMGGKSDDENATAAREVQCGIGLASAECRMSF